MSNRILVAYATRAGSTQGVAEAIAAVLDENGLKADLRKAREVRSLQEYDAVILGAPLYVFRWHADAMGFLKRLRTNLEKMPVAVFALGPFHEDEKEKQDARELLDKELGFFYRLLMAFPANPMKNVPPSDARNWPEIKEWAAILAKQWQ